MQLRGKSADRINITDPIAVAHDPKNVILRILKSKFEGKCSKDSVLVTKVTDVDIPDDVIIPIYQSGCSSDAYVDVIYSYDCIVYRPSAIVPRATIIKISEKNMIASSEYCDFSLSLVSDFAVQIGQVYPVKIRDGPVVKYKIGMPKIAAIGTLFGRTNIMDPIFVSYNGKQARKFTSILEDVGRATNRCEVMKIAASDDYDFFEKLLYPYVSDVASIVERTNARIMSFEEVIAAEFVGWVVYLPGRTDVAVIDGSQLSADKRPVLDGAIDPHMVLSVVMICYVDHMNAIADFVESYAGPPRREMEIYWKYVASKKEGVSSITNVA